ncbi:hypothetical protein GOEFS_015_00480 [Gordonia effusa NBRC 100432]|uniref:Uncharacterized protein n=1 Tax=Gordonia effusa NBRC 100432 TaxID=1077974 RepID=H0QVH4_9ACTN|nr:hypothetical protein [Gordonia effusa]GAB16851.1 hypothetical protein GOEFS_015_00480 [Gordonia effusa NBRC 100432]
MSTRIVAVIGLVASAVAVGLTLVKWIDFTELGMPFAWTGLATYVGQHADHYGPMLAGAITPVGWVAVLAAVLVCAASVLALVDVSSIWRTAVGAVAALASVVAAGVVAAIIVRPEILLDDFLTMVGAESYGSNAGTLRPFLVTPVLYAEIAALIVMGATAGWLALRGSRRGEA